MNKESFLTFLGILILVIVGVSIYYMTSGIKAAKVNNTTPENTVVTNDTTTTTEENEDIEYGNSSLEEYTFKDEYGSGEKSVTIKAKKCDRLQGFTGAGSNVFYIDWEDKLHYLELGHLKDTVIATNIVDFEITDEGITAYYNDTYSKVEENNYVTYKKN